MASGIPTEIDAAAAYLAALEPDEREKKLKAIRNLAVLRAPEDRVVGEPPVRTLAEYLAHEIETPPMLVQPGQVARGAITALIARAGKGKTTMTLNRILRWSIGQPMFSDLPDVMAPTAPLKTLVIENEGAPGFFQEKLQLMFDAQGFNAEQREQSAENVLIWGEGGWPRIKLDDEATYELVRRGIETHAPDLVLMEPFRSLWKGEENSSTEMQALVDAIATLAAEYKIGVILTHHERKSGPGEDGEEMSAGRGSTVLEGEAAVMERWKQVKGETSELSWVKWRFAKPVPPVRMTFDWQKWGYEFVPEDAGRREIKELLIENGSLMTVKEMADELHETEKRVRRLANELADDPEENVKAERSIHSAAGSTGKRYRVVMDETQASEGLDY